MPMPLILTLLLLVLSSGATTAGEVYRHVDEDGNVTFSDERGDDKSEPMELKSIPEVNMPEPAQRQRPSREERSGEKEETEETEEQEGYQSITISQPEHDSAFWRGDGLVVVRFQSEPGLRSGHRYVVELDGEKVEEGRSESLTLENMDRGTHEVVVHIVNGDGKTLTSSDVTRFTLHRPSQLN